MAAIRLLLVDDHEVVRTGLRMLLESQANMLIVGEASTGGQALTLAEELAPQVIVMDITLPDISGIEVTRLLRNKYPEMAIVALNLSDKKVEVTLHLPDELRAEREEMMFARYQSDAEALLNKPSCLMQFEPFEAAIYFSKK